MTRYKPNSKSVAYLVSGAIFPSDGANINPALPFYARQIADGDLILADSLALEAGENTNADDGENQIAARGETKTKRKG